jgi:predicted nucleic acid-binding protein
MSLPVVVPDASVLLKWVLPGEEEPGADRALLLRDAIVGETLRAFVPALWIYEVGNTIARRFPIQASDWLSALLKFGLSEIGLSQRWLSKTLELTHRHDVSFYDAAYHSIALLYGGIFVTADARYATRAESSGAVTILGEWDPPRSSGGSRRRR